MPVVKCFLASVFFERRSVFVRIGEIVELREGDQLHTQVPQDGFQLPQLALILSRQKQ